MKHYASILIALLFFGCSTNDDSAEETARTTDPIIGSWYLTIDGNGSPMIYNFNENGSGETIDGGTFPMRWENQNDNFDSTSQSYIIEDEGRISFDVVFSLYVLFNSNGL